MSKQYYYKIIQQLKQYRQRQLSITQFLYIFCQLQYKKQNFQTPLNYIQTFIKQNYSHDNINWKEITEDVLVQIHEDLTIYINKNRQKWQNKQLEEGKQMSELTQQCKRIKKILKDKNITKEELIDTYMEEIRRNKLILTKNASFKSNNSETKTEVKQSTQKIQQKTGTEVLVQKQKYESNITLLQSRINLMRNSSKFDSQTIEDQSAKDLKSLLQKRQQQLSQIVKQFQFKKRYFEQEENNFFLEQLFAFQKKLATKKRILTKRLKQLFVHYTSENYDVTLTFEKNNEKLKMMDLRLFLKYCKQLKQANLQTFSKLQEDQNMLKTKNIHVLFKRQISNQVEINFQQFEKINYQMFLKINPDSKSTQNANQFVSILDHKMVDLAEQKKQQIVLSLQKMQKIHPIFFNEKIDKILNIHTKGKALEEQEKSKKLQKTTNSDEIFLSSVQKRQKNSIKLIDKSLADYEETKKQIHQTLLRRKIRHDLEYPLTPLTDSQDKIKVIVTKGKKSTQVKDTIQIKPKNKIKTYTDKQSIRKSGKSFDHKIVNRSASHPKIEKLFNKNIFQDIIQEANIQSEDQEDKEQFNAKVRSRSQGDLLKYKPKQSQSTGIRSHSSVKQKHQSMSAINKMFILPKITRLSQEKLQNQSIVKTLSYLYEALGKRQQPRIKQILQLDNPQSQKANAYQNQCLKQYFNKEQSLNEQQKKHAKQTKHNRIQCVHKKCHKFKEDNYQKFMKFS